MDLYETVMRRFVGLGLQEVLQQHQGEIYALGSLDYRDWLLSRGFPEVLTRLRDFLHTSLAKRLTETFALRELPVDKT